MSLAKVGFAQNATVRVYNYSPEQIDRMWEQQALTTWYASSSSITARITSSSDREEFLSFMALNFIQREYEMIAEESAKGSGQHVATLATLNRMS